MKRTKKVDPKAKFKPKVPWTTPRNQYTNPKLELMFRKMLPGTRFNLVEAQTSQDYRRSPTVEFYQYQPRKKLVTLYMTWIATSFEKTSFRAAKTMTLEEVAKAIA